MKATDDFKIVDLGDQFRHIEKIAQSIGGQIKSKPDPVTYVMN